MVPHLKIFAQEFAHKTDLLPSSIPFFPCTTIIWQAIPINS